MGGRGFSPPQPAGAADGTYGAGPWKPSDGEDRFRRGLYTFAKRTNPFAMIATFDGPSGEACLVRRETSNTPLQSLTMLNDVMLADFTKALSKRALEHEGTDADRTTHLVRLCLMRTPTADELRLLTAFHKTQHERFRLDPDRADAFGGAGPGAADRAAWAAVARAILNLDEFITKE